MLHEVGPFHRLSSARGNIWSYQNMNNTQTACHTMYITLASWGRIIENWHQQTTLCLLLKCFSTGSGNNLRSQEHGISCNLMGDIAQRTCIFNGLAGLMWFACLLTPGAHHSICLLFSHLENRPPHMIREGQLPGVPENDVLALGNIFMCLLAPETSCARH